MRRALAGIGPTKEEELVRRLATDDEFRAQLAESPIGVLADYDIDLSPTELPSDVVLPPRQQLAEALRAMSSGHLAPVRASLAPRAKFWPALCVSGRPPAC
jgi:hypothetical protein